MHYGSITHIEDSTEDRFLMSPWAIASILSTAFAYGCTMTTFFLLVLPLECRRIEAQIMQVSSSSTYYSNYSSLLQILGNKSVALGIFAAIAGLAQLISPLIGLLSDCYIPPKRFRHLYLLGKRLPYIFLGTFLTLIGIAWEFISAGLHYQQDEDLVTLPMVLWPWFHYYMAFLIHNVGLNITYTVMMCLIPDLVPTSQIGQANGIFALLLVMGSLFGFAIFQTVVSDGSFFSNNTASSENSSSVSTTTTTHNNDGVLGMYKVYFGVSMGAMALTYHFVMQRLHQMRKQSPISLSATLHPSGNHVTTHESLETYFQSSMAGITSSSSTMINDPHPPLMLNNPPTNNRVYKSSTSNWPPIHLIMYFLLYEPIATKSMSEIRSAYWVESTGIYHDFFIVTISRLFYYMGISSQTFFLYYVHDVVVNGNNYNTSSTDRPPPLSSSVLVHPEVTVAVLAIIGQMSGALTCYPVGILSDKYFDGRRKPFVYLSCLLLSIGYLTLLLSDSLNQIMGICILLGAANGMYLTMDTSLAVDTLPSSSTPILDHSSNHSLHDQIIHEEDKMESAQCIDKKSQSDPHGAAQLLGVWGVFGFIGSSVGPLIGGMVLFLLGKPDDSNLDSYYSQRGYTVLFSLSAFYFFCAAISLTYIQKKGV